MLGVPYFFCFFGMVTKIMNQEIKSGRRKVLVTGSSGRLGYHLCKFLAVKGNYSVVGLSTTKMRGLDQVDWKYCDLLDRDSVMSLMASVRPDIVVDLAGVVPRRGQRRAVFAQNEIMCKNVADAAIRFGVVTMIYGSSAYIYGIASDVIIDEQTEPNPSDEYAWSKYFSEQAIVKLARKKNNNTKFFILRMAPVISDRWNDWSTLIGLLARCWIPLPFANAAAKRSYLSSTKFLNAVDLILDNASQAGDVYILNVADENPVSLGELASNIAGPNCRVKLISSGRWMQYLLFLLVGKSFERYSKNFVLSTEKLKKDFSCVN